jgi:maleylacetate reductase
LRAAHLISAAFESEPPAREDLALGSLLAGYASGIAGIAVHHAVCQTIVRAAGTPHAYTNAIMLPHSVRMMEARAPDAIARLARAFGVAEEGGAGAWVTELAARAGKTRLSELGVDSTILDAVVATALEHPALGNTPDPPEADELRAMLTAAL